ncbi:MAG TPA: aldehyde ferredoxin oxidoreductase C-terminal domain-containing protein, partial [Anaerolineaceae bacterium]|nr:aldehyde ferredoxin oxidoreductase C-terminal domain-containing protein [Anaerolineaceae bacterium]
LLNRAGMDSISAGTTVAYAVECYENGLITDADTGGLKLKWGNSEDIISLVKKMIARDGIGDFLADGVKRAVEHFGEPTRKYAMHVGGMEPGMHDPKVDPQLGIHFVADPTPGRHTIGTTLMYSMMGLEDICTWAPAPKLHPKSEDIAPTMEHGLASMANACYTQITDGAGGCYFGEMLGVHLWRLVDYLNVASGWTLSGDEYMEIGKRIQTMRQLFNVRQGLKPADWHLPERIEGKPPATEGVIKGITLRTDENVRYHWKAFGWDETTGEPLAATVNALGIPALLAVAEV